MQLILARPRLRIASADVAIFADGNSLTAGQGASTSAFRWPAQLASISPVAGSGITPSNRGVSGQSIKLDAGFGTMMARGPSAIDANLVAGKKNLLLTFEFTNEAKSAGNNATLMHSAMAAYCNARKAAASAAGRSLIIVVGTAPPAGADPLVNGSTAQGRIDARNAALIAANGLLRENYWQYADVLWDLAAEPVFATIFAGGVYTTDVFQASGLWDRSDGVANDYTHFGNAGYAVIAASAARAIARVRR